MCLWVKSLHPIRWKLLFCCSGLCKFVDRVVSMFLLATCCGCPGASQPPKGKPCTHGQDEEENPENPQEKVPQQSPRKRKATAKSGRNDKLKKKAKKQKKKDKQQKLNELSHNQCTISQQLIDFDLKLEALHCAFSKANLSSFMDNIVEKVKEIRAVVSAPAPAAAPASVRQTGRALRPRRARCAPQPAPQPAARSPH